MKQVVPFRTEQEAFWAGSFGDLYSRRNSGPEIIASNVRLFTQALARTEGIASCIEFGANIGLNIKALRILYPGLKAQGVEINPRAARVLAKAIGPTNVFSGSLFDFRPKRPVDLALIKGVLIHLNPDLLSRAYDRLYAASARWILICEYYNPHPVEVEYRGHKSRLFKRDFAGEMLDRHSRLRLVDYGFAYHRDNAFPQDDLSWFLLEKKSS